MSAEALSPLQEVNDRMIVMKKLHPLVQAIMQVPNIFNLP